MKRIALLLFVMSPSSLSAQFSYDIAPSPLQISTNYIQTSGISDSLADERRNRSDGSTDYEAEDGSVLRPELSPEALYKSLAFIPNVQRRRKTLSTLATELEVGNPGRGAEFKALLLGDGSGDIIQKLKPAVAPHGLNVDNLVDAYAAYWITAWQGSRGALDVQPNAKQITAVKDLTARALGNMPQVANAASANKQAFAEVLWVQMLVIESAAQGVVSNPSSMPQFKAAVRAQAKSLGVDLDSFILTPEGFILAK